ncbi:RPAP1-like, C-terminal domain containing protein [Naviculisporaceae sp. PSN 640]
MESTLQVFDIKEREVTKPPSFPTPIATSTGTGFPVHKKRVSAFKKKRQPQPEEAPKANGASENKPPSSGPNPSRISEKDTIDRENRAVLDNMSQEEIAGAQKELFNALDPSLIQMLLRRANLDDGAAPSFDTLSSNETPKVDAKTSDPAPSEPTSQSKPTNAPTPEAPQKDAPNTKAKKSAYLSPTCEEEESSSQPAKTKTKKSVHFSSEQKEEPSQPPKSADEIETPTAFPKNTTHFPRLPEEQDPELDPSDPDFLENLHKKYFPNLPADPSKLAWMAPLPTPNSTADRESPYYPGQNDFPVSSLRFDFRGRLLPPKLSRQIPVTKGLHHHGEAPEAAGYTIPELARLARSSVPGQRCIAFRTLGRMLFRLGNGEWGTGAGGRDGEEDDLAFGLWRCFSEGRVLESLEEEASLPDGVGHMSSKAYAVEALWLFEKGGWKEKWRGL